MMELFQDGRAIDVLLGLMALEAVVLAGWRGRTGTGPRPRELLATLAAGAGLLLALRCALAGSSWHWIALWLLVALAAHVADLAGRWRAGP